MERGAGGGGRWWAMALGCWGGVSRQVWAGVRQGLGSLQEAVGRGWASGRRELGFCRQAGGFARQVSGRSWAGFPGGPGISRLFLQGFPFVGLKAGETVSFDVA